MTIECGCIPCSVSEDEWRSMGAPPCDFQRWQDQLLDWYADGAPVVGD